MMKKSLIAMGVAAAMTLPFAAQAASADVQGYADIRYMIQDEAADDTGGTLADPTNPSENKFSAGGEVDFTAASDAVSARIDVNLALDPGASSSGADIEQAYFAWKAHESVTVIGGVFNDPIGLEAEDSWDLKTITHGLFYDVLDGATTLDGDNVAGVAAAFGLGPVNVTVGLLNDLQQTDEKNSVALVVGGEVMKDLNVEFGYVTQDNDSGLAPSGFDGAGAGNVWDLNATYTMGGLGLSAEIMDAAEILDVSYGVGASYDFGNGFAAAFNYDTVTFDISGADDLVAMRLAGSYALASNLKVRGEFRNDDDGTDDFNTIQLQFVASLP